MKKIDKNQLDLFGPQIWYEYLLVISPDKEITEEINVRKQKINSLIRTDVAYINSVPHISLLNFLHTEHEMILKRVTAILTKQNSFQVKLNGVAFFEPTPESKTLYVRVSDKLLIQTLTDKLKDSVGRGKKSNPHLTIAGEISSKNHQLINDQLADLKLEATFLCQGITLLRRLKSDPPGTWDFRVDLPFEALIAEKDNI